jgi:hypothetical protein
VIELGKSRRGYLPMSKKEFRALMGRLHDRNPGLSKRQIYGKARSMAYFAGSVEGGRIRYEYSRRSAKEW